MTSISLLALACLSLIIQVMYTKPSLGEYILIPQKNIFSYTPRPYYVPEDERFSFKNGIQKLWLFSRGKPHSLTSKTNPRTGIHIQGHNYSSGVWQFEGHGSVMQVVGGSQNATTLINRVYNGSFTYYRDAIMVSKIYNKRFRPNVIHDVDNSNVKVCINEILKYETPGRRGTFHYFKYGVHAQDDDFHYMESCSKASRF